MSDASAILDYEPIALTYTNGYIPFRGVGNRMMQFDNGVGTVTIKTEGANRAIVLAVAVGHDTSGSHTTFTKAVTHNGTPLTLLGVIDSGGVAGKGFLALYGLLNPPLGDVTINVSITNPGVSVNLTIAQAATYSDVLSFGAVTTTTGNSSTLTQTVSATPGQRLVTAMTAGEGWGNLDDYVRYADENIFSRSAGADHLLIRDVSPRNANTTYNIAQKVVFTTAWTAMTVVLNPTAGLSLAAQCELIWEETLKQERAERELRRQKPVVQIYDGDWNMHYELTQEYDAQFSWISNDSGPGKTTIPFNTEVAQWIHQWQERIDRGEKRNVHITVDYCGARWSGRLDQANVMLTEDGDKALEVTWLHDYENLKWYSVWSNPFLPAAFQAPRVFILAGPVPWVLKMSLFLNILREHNPLITIPDDPLDISSWFTSLDQSTWNVRVAPGGFLQNMADGHIWGMASSRWSNWHDMSKQMLEDAEYSVVCRRWFTGDPIPEGFNPATMVDGQLIVDIADKSGVYIGTSNGGSLFDGIARTFFEFADDFIDSTEEVVLDNTIPTDYFTVGKKFTDKRLPYVIYEEGIDSGIKASEFIVSPAKGIQVNVGGHSMPGINESISATIQFAGDVLGNFAQIGGLGGTIDGLVKPLYEDTILAWWSVKSTARAQNSGWGRYFEYFQEGASKAYTIASLMVLRAGFWATKTTISVRLSVIDGAPWMIGDMGLGHFFLDDRIGIVLKDDIRKKIHMDRCRKLDLAWGEESPPEWELTIGDDRALQDPAQRAWGKIESMIAALRELGAY